MTPEQLKFLRALQSRGAIATPQELRLPADRAQDRARQKCRRDGLVTFKDGYWRLTDIGHAELAKVTIAKTPAIIAKATGASQ